MDAFLEKLMFDPTLNKLLLTVAGLLLVVVFVRALNRYLSKLISDVGSRYRVRKFVIFAGYISGLGIITAVFSDKLGGLNVALGVAGAGVAFALQEVIVSIAGWFAVTFSSFYRVGDRVQLGGIKGDVIDIGVLRTTLMEVGDWVNGDLYNGRVVRIANSFVFKEPVFNYSGDFPFLWDEIQIPIKYNSDEKLARQLIHKVLREVVGDYVVTAQQSWDEMVRKYMLENARLEPMVTLSIDENWMTYTVRYVVDYKSRRLTRDELFTRVLEEIVKTDGRVIIASASQEISLMQTPTVDVRVGGREQQ